MTKEKHFSYGISKPLSDDFHVRWEDVENEMNAYLDYNPDVFRGKSILLPCDDPETSDFAKYFAIHFEKFGIRRLMAVSYGELDAGGTRRGKKHILSRADFNGDGKVDYHDFRWEYLDGDGDFRSEEVTALRDQFDMVITCPPFSLLRKFLNWVVDGGVDFAVVGTAFSITYPSLFPLVMEDKLWAGASRFKTGMTFRAGSTYPLEEGGFRNVGGENRLCIAGSQWLTSIEHGRRHEKMTLMTYADNIQFSKHKRVRGVGYKRYENYDAIHISSIDSIPSDYPGIMGVSGSILNFYSPEQFEILGVSSMPETTATFRRSLEFENVAPLVAGKGHATRVFIRNRRAR